MSLARSQQYNDLIWDILPPYQIFYQDSVGRRVHDEVRKDICIIKNDKQTKTQFMIRAAFDADVWHGKVKNLDQWIHFAIYHQQRQMHFNRGRKIFINPILEINLTCGKDFRHAYELAMDLLTLDSIQPEEKMLPAEDSHYRFVPEFVKCEMTSNLMQKCQALFDFVLTQTPFLAEDAGAYDEYVKGRENREDYALQQALKDQADGTNPANSDTRVHELKKEIFQKLRDPTFFAIKTVDKQYPQYFPPRLLY